MKYEFKPKFKDFSKRSQQKMLSYVDHYISEKKKTLWKSGDLKKDLGFRKMVSSLIEDPSVYSDSSHASRRLHYLVPQLLDIYVKKEKLCKTRKGDNSRTYYIKR
tara:strand:- start:12 stop:326 length:315 start_codon:yes stop_codon:yes gene_type:complete